MRPRGRQVGTRRRRRRKKEREELHHRRRSRCRLCAIQPTTTTASIKSLDCLVPTGNLTSQESSNNKEEGEKVYFSFPLSFSLSSHHRRWSLSSRRLRGRLAIDSALSHFHFRFVRSLYHKTTGCYSSTFFHSPATNNLSLQQITRPKFYCLSSRGRSCRPNDGQS